MLTDLAVDRVNLVDPIAVGVIVVVLGGLGYVGRQLVVSALRVVRQVEKIAADLAHYTEASAVDRRRLDDVEDVVEETRTKVAVLKSQLDGHERWHERGTMPGIAT